MRYAKLFAANDLHWVRVSGDRGEPEARVIPVPAQRLPSHEGQGARDVVIYPVTHTQLDEHNRPHHSSSTWTRYLISDQGSRERPGLGELPLYARSPHAARMVAERFHLAVRNGLDPADSRQVSAWALDVTRTYPEQLVLVPELLTPDAADRAANETTANIERKRP